MRVLITGAAGFVGSTLARSLLRIADVEVVGLDNLSFGYEERVSDIRDRFEFVRADVFDMKRLWPGRWFDLIVHCAAIAPLPECQISSARALQQNVAACGAVCDFACSYGSRNIVFFSSGAIYEGVTQFPTPESVTVRPRLVYPITKYLAEQYFETMTRGYGLNVFALRLFNLYGPHQDYFRKQPPLIGYLLKALLNDETAVLFSTGEQRRDYVHIDDLIRLVMLSSDFMRSGTKEGQFVAVNVGSGRTTSVNDIIDSIEKIAGKKIKIERRDPGGYWDKYSEFREQSIRLNPEIIREEVLKHTHADIGRAERLLGWKPAVTLEDGLKQCVDHARSVFGGPRP